MSIFRQFADGVYYHLDNIRSLKLNITIENFRIDKNHENIFVMYRLGRQKLLNKMNLKEFERTYYENISSFDKQRLAKFLTLQYILKQLFVNNNCKKEELLDLIEAHSKNEQLF